MKLLNLYIILCIALLGTQCAQQDLPEPFENDPVFTISAEIGGQSLDIAAGINDYYMFTSFARDDQEVLVFKGDLKQETCPEVCGKQFRIEIRDHQTSAAGEPSDLSVLMQDITFLTPIVPEVTTTYQVSFQAITMGNDSSTYVYLWDFGDGQIETVANPVHDYEIGGEYNVVLTTVDENGCESSQMQVVNTLNPDEECAIDINVRFIQNTQIVLEATGGGNNDLYLWNADSVFNEIVLPTETGMYCVSLLDNSICQSMTCAGVQFVNPTFPQYCVTSYTYEIDSTINVEPVDSFQFAKVSIIYTDELGQEYRSDLGPQEQSIFNITSVKDFDRNENDEQTKMIEFDLTCQLYHENGEVLELTNGQFVVGVAYP